MHSDLLNWLFRNGGEIIKYNVVNDFEFEIEKYNILDLKKKKLNSIFVKEWCNKFLEIYDKVSFHNARSYCFENILFKLIDLGLKAGDKILDEKTLWTRKWLEKSLKKNKNERTLWLEKILLNCLAYAGYINEQYIQDLMNQHINILYEYCKNKDFNLYKDNNEKQSIPASYKKKPILKDKYALDDFCLPNIYDIYGFVNFYKNLKYQKKIETVINYVLDSKYQALSPGYGYLKQKNNKYIHVGWAVNLPGFFSYNFDDWKSGFISNENYTEEYRRSEYKRLSRWGIPCSFVQRLELMSHFKNARNHRWYTDSINFLEKYKTEKGTYLFPEKFLQEKKSGNWVIGAYMGLHKGVRSRKILEIESTFRMLKLKNKIKN